MTENTCNPYGNLNKQDHICQLVEENLALVKHIISRMEVSLPMGMDREDLVSIGNFGLIEAAQNFDPRKNVKFQTYAYIKIRGAILDEIRRFSFGGQAILRKQKKIMDVYQILEQRYRRVPTDEELAQELQIPIDKYNKMVQETSGAYLLSLDDYVEEDDHIRMIDTLSDEGDFVEDMISAEVVNEVVAAVDQLPEQEKLVLSLYYEQELSLKEVSLIMELSESRISQIHKKAIHEIKTCVGESDG